MRGSGTHPPTAALFPSPIHAKFLSLGKLRKALCHKAFNSYALKIHPHDFKKTQKCFRQFSHGKGTYAFALRMYYFVIRC
jgi:hypothetical protein